MSTRLNLDSSGYREYDGISNSMLKDLDKSPALYYGRYITKQIPGSKETPASRFGTLCHMRMLEPDRWFETVRVPPAGDRRTKAGQAAFKEWSEGLPEGVEIITAGEWHRVQDLARSVEAHPMVKKYITGVNSVREVAISWDDDHGLHCKALLDFWADSGYVLDFKFVADPTPEWWKMPSTRYRRYHWQAAHYLDGVSRFQLCEPHDIPFYFCCVQSEEPYDLYMYQMDPELIQTGAESLSRAKDVLKYCQRTGSWMPPRSYGLNVIEKELWAYDEDSANGK